MSHTQSSIIKRHRPSPRRARLLALGLLLLLTLACSATDNLDLSFLSGGDIQGAVETSVYQTRQVSELQTAAAGGGGAADESTPEPAAQATAAPAADCPAPGPPPDLGSITLPASLGELTQEGGQWYLDGVAVQLVNQLNADCSATLWLTLAGQDAWPLLVQEADSGWALGTAYWNGELTVVNTNDTPLTLGILPVDAATVEDSDPAYQQLSGYQIYQLGDLPPGTYLFSFAFQGDESFDLSCSLDFQADARVVFSVVPVGVAVFVEGFPPASPTDVDITTSTLCGN